MLHDEALLEGLVRLASSDAAFVVLASHESMARGTPSTEDQICRDRHANVRQLARRALDPFVDLGPPPFGVLVDLDALSLPAGAWMLCCSGFPSHGLCPPWAKKLHHQGAARAARSCSTSHCESSTIVRARWHASRSPMASIDATMEPRP